MTLDRNQTLPDALLSRSDGLFMTSPERAATELPNVTATRLHGRLGDENCLAMMMAGLALTLRLVGLASPRLVDLPVLMATLFLVGRGALFRSLLNERISGRGRATMLATAEVLKRQIHTRRRGPRKAAGLGGGRCQFGRCGRRRHHWGIRGESYRRPRCRCRCPRPLSVHP